MPGAFISAGQTDITVTRSVVRDVVKSIARNSHFPEDLTLVYEGQDTTGTANPNGYFNSCTDPITRTRFNAYAFIEYKETASELLGTDLGRYMDHIPIFDDPKIGLMLIPQYREHKLEITVRFRCDSKTKLSSWLSSYKSASNSRNNFGFLSARYYFKIPTEFMAFLYDAWEMQTVYGNPGDSYDYITSHFYSQPKIDSTITGNQKRIIYECGLRNLTAVLTNPTFYNDITSEDGVHEVSINLEVHYPKAEGVSIIYPAMIHNQLVPDKYLKRWSQYYQWLDKWQDPVKPMSYIGNTLKVFETEASTVYLGDGGARLLPWDNWFPKTPVKDTQTICIAPIFVDVENPTYICNITELAGDYIPDDVMAYIGADEKRGQVGNSLIRFELYQIDETEKRTYLVPDDNLNLYAKENLDLLKRNYLRISLVRNFANVMGDSLLQLTRLGEPLVKILPIYNPDVTIYTDQYEYEEAVIESQNDDIPKAVPNGILAINGKANLKTVDDWRDNYEVTIRWKDHPYPDYPKGKTGLTRTLGSYHLGVK